MGIRHFAAGAAACALIVASSCAAFAGTFKDLQEKIDAASNGATITLTEDYKYVDSADRSVVSRDTIEDFNEGVLISKDITIDGGGHTIDGAGMMRVFRIGKSPDLDENNRYKVTLKNMTIKSGDYAPAGSAIFVGVSHDVTIKSVDIKENTTRQLVHTRDGGVIMIYAKSNVTIEDSIIRNNSNVSNNARTGGIITRGDLVVRNCVVKGNRGSGRGGGIYVDCGYKSPQRGGEYGGSVKVYDSIVEENVANRGGGIYINPENKKMSLIEDTIIRNNDLSTTNVSNGGGILVYNGAATVRNCKITGNKALRGGGVFVDVESEMTIESCDITGNKVLTAPQSGVAAVDQNIGGGIIFFDGSNANQKMDENVGKLTIKNSNVTGNTNKDGAADDVFIHYYDTTKYDPGTLHEGRISRYDGEMTSEGGNKIGALTNPENFKRDPSDVIGSISAMDAPDAEWKPSNGDLVIVLSDNNAKGISFDLFEGVSIDSVVLTRGTDYEAVKGSTKITLYGDKYLSSLSKGEHTVDITFTGGGKHTMKLNVTEAANRSSGSSGCAMGAFGVAAAAFAALKLRRKK